MQPEPQEKTQDAQPGLLHPVVRSLCECVNWCRANIGAPYNLRGRDGVPLVTNHHPNCPHYNDSLIDVWAAKIDGNTCYCEHEQDARETVGEEGWETAEVSKIKMHREVFEHLPEFEGF